MGGPEGGAGGPASPGHFGQVNDRFANLVIFALGDVRCGTKAVAPTTLLLDNPSEA